MAMTVTSLSNRILQNLKNSFNPADDTLLVATCDAIAAGVIAEITQNAVVTTTVTGASATGGPVTGTGTGNIA